MKFKCPISLFVLVFFTLLTGCSDNTGSTPPLALVAPARVAAVNTETLVVSDYTANRFCLVDEKSLAVTDCVDAKGQPTGVAYAEYDGGRYFVGNKSVGSVDIYDRRGVFLGHVGGRTNLFGKVNDLAVDPGSNRLYVLDSKAARVRVFDFGGGDLHRDIGGGVLQQPTAIAIDPTDGRVFVSDFGLADDFEDSSIEVFDSDGQTLTSIPGKSGGMLGSLIFSAPQGLFVDGSGNLFFVDSGFSQVFVYDASLQLKKTVGVRGAGEGELFYPLDLVVDENSRDIFVSDTRNGRVIVFRGEGVLP